MAMLHEEAFAAQSTGDSCPSVLGENYNMASHEIGFTASVKAEFTSDKRSRIKILILDRIHVPPKIADEFLSVTDDTQIVASASTTQLFRRVIRRRF